MDRSIGHSTLFGLVDPLDGIKEFVKRTNEFTVNIALMEDQAAVLGVVDALAEVVPETDVLLLAPPLPPRADEEVDESLLGNALKVPCTLVAAI